MYYKNSNGQMLSGNNVMNKNYTLTRDKIETSSIDGWQWFNTEEEAYLFFGIEKTIPLENEENATVKRRKNINDKKIR